jgi:hypothetical protein
LSSSSVIVSPKEKRKKNYNGKRKYNKKLEKVYESIKKVQVQSWCWYLSSSSVVVSPGGWVRRQLCAISGSSSSATYCQPSTFAGSAY